MTPPLLHVLGAGPWQIPTVRLAKEMGYRVLVTDCFPERPAYQIADHHEVADITDFEATLAVARRHHIDGILCDTTDTGVRTAAYVAQQMGLPGMGLDAATNFTHKGRMRLLTRQAGLQVPPFRLARVLDDLTGIPEAFALPLIVKPVDSQSGKGVSLVREAWALGEAFTYALRHTREGTVLVEALVEGQEIIVDGFMHDGQANILGIAKKVPHPRQPTVSLRITYGHFFPPPVRARIAEVNQLTINALGLRDGVFHAEYMVSGDDVVPIDVAARGGGCMIYTHVLPEVSGVDAHRAMIRLTMGESVGVAAMRQRAANIEFIDLPEGTLTAIEGLDACAQQPGVLGLDFNVKVGSRIGPLLAKDDRPGYILAGGDTAEAAISATHRALACLRARIVDGSGHVSVSNGGDRFEVV
jgi:biotin carboxylase